ncbi:MAG: aspartate aminotransferase family protein [Pseudomonadota bacterium]|nr:aspartate aminotransferase family protein [Pseudomonadota bacterium]
MTPEHHIDAIAGGVMSLNRAIDPMRTFTRAKGAYLFDDQDKRYIDYHAAFSPYLLGHGDDDVDNAVRRMLDSGASLIGAGTTPWEMEVADLIVDCVDGLEQIQVTNSGTEAVMYALRLARAATGRNDVLIMQGGYNGGTDYVSFNLMDPSDAVQDHLPGTAYPLRPITAGIPDAVQQSVHVVEFNDLPAAEMVLSNSNIAALILEPILQNIGIVKPEPGYLEGLRKLCDRYGTVLIFDEVKTGFRHGLGGYQNIAGVTPDLSIFGKAVANGYPMGVVGGKESVMQYCATSDPKRRVVVAGTYNGHPLVVAAAIATLNKLKTREDEIYGKLDALGERMASGLESIFEARNYPATIVRQGSAFVVYFMDHAPSSWREIAIHNDAVYDVDYRKALIENGVFHFPVTTKQGSISFAHGESDIDETLDITERVLNRVGQP